MHLCGELNIHGLHVGFDVLVGTECAICVLNFNS